MTGPVTIISDPGTTDLPIISGTTSAAQVTIATTAGPLVHIGGVDLTGGAGIDVASLGTARTHDNHNIVLVTNPFSTTVAPTFTFDASSKMNLEDNDLIVHNGDFASIQAAAVVGRHGTDGSTGHLADGKWDGNGLTSSKAAARPPRGLEKTALAVVKYGDLLLRFAGGNYVVGSTSVHLIAADTIVKYTYVDDFALEGMVTDNAQTIFGISFGNVPATFRNNDYWASGSYNGGSVLDDAQTIFGIYFGNGTGADGTTNARL